LPPCRPLPPPGGGAGQRGRGGRAGNPPDGRCRAEEEDRDR
jgi:hypothetical protein